MRNQGIGHELYAARRAVCKRLNLRRILSGGETRAEQSFTL